MVQLWTNFCSQQISASFWQNRGQNFLECNKFYVESTGTKIPLKVLVSREYSESTLILYASTVCKVLCKDLNFYPCKVACVKVMINGSYIFSDISYQNDIDAARPWKILWGEGATILKFSHSNISTQFMKSHCIFQNLLLSMNFQQCLPLDYSVLIIRLFGVIKFLKKYMYNHFQ